MYCCESWSRYDGTLPSGADVELKTTLLTWQARLARCTGVILPSVACAAREDTVWAALPFTPNPDTKALTLAGSAWQQKRTRRRRGKRPVACQRCIILRQSVQLEQETRYLGFNSRTYANLINLNRDGRQADSGYESKQKLGSSSTECKHRHSGCYCRTLQLTCQVPGRWSSWKCSEANTMRLPCRQHRSAMPLTSTKYICSCMGT